MEFLLSLKSVLGHALFLIILVGAFNHIYVAFFGIRRMDRHFSRKPDPCLESQSPFDAFYRLHKYSFLYSLGVRRPSVDIGMSLWLYFSCFSLSCIWITLGLAALAKYLYIGPFS